MRLADLHKDQRPFDLDLEEGTLSVTYQPSKVTRRAMREAIEAAGDAERDPVAAPVEVLVRLLTYWDLEGENGTVPITTEGLDDLPSNFLARVLKGIQKDAQLVSEGKA